MSKVIIEEIEFLSGYEDEDASSPWEPTGNKQTDMESQVGEIEHSYRTFNIFSTML
ncbi:hypothetical protein DPMN_078215 [Dreissena polymorpha]|uniref:Uncharacterized protein n=1 Tax=Dreissena polymorpha TaxID=45954 RepID=A0A9D3YLU4_DREPO|nr:hypothetical protein DPMN_078215 [Dreissena polymorpha]